MKRIILVGMAAVALTGCTPAQRSLWGLLGADLPSLGSESDNVRIYTETWCGDVDDYAFGHVPKGHELWVFVEQASGPLPTCNAPA